MSDTPNTPWDLIDPETSPGKSKHEAKIMSRIRLRDKIMRRVAMRGFGISVESELDKLAATVLIEKLKNDKPALYAEIIKDLMENPDGIRDLMGTSNSSDGMPASYRDAVEAGIRRQLENKSS